MNESKTIITTKRSGRVRPTKRSNQRNRKSTAPTTVQKGMSPWNTALHKVPLFPVRARQPNQLYYDWAKGGVGSPGVPLFRTYTCNGLFDPDISGTGHQPIGFDTMMSLYTQYTVLRSRISVTVAADQATRITILLSPDTTQINDPITLTENGLLSSRVIDGNAANGGTGQRIRTFELDCDIAKYFSRRRGDILNDRSLSGTVSSNPTEQVYFQIVAWLPFDSSAAPTMYFDVLLSYDVVYWEPRKLNTS